MTARVHGPGSALLSWTLRFSGGLPVTNFTIDFRLNDSSSWHSALVTPWNQTSGATTVHSSALPTIVSASSRQAVIYGLESQQYYQFRVAGSNEMGTGGYSKTLQAVLSDTEGVPSPPAKPVIVGWGPNEVVLSTSISNIGGSNTSGLRLGTYEIEAGAGELRLLGVQTSLDYVEGDVVTLTWDDVRYHGDLRFQLYALNHLGRSLPSEVSLKGG